MKAKGGTTLFSRRGNILNRKFHYIATALKKLPDNTVLDGELVALDEDGKSDFGLLHNFRSAESKIHYYDAKRSDSPYEPGKRTGLWQKYRLNLQQEFVIGGYTSGALGFDALIIGFYRGKDLIFAARVRAGLSPRHGAESTHSSRA